MPAHSPVPLDQFLTKQFADSSCSCLKDVSTGKAFLYGAGAALGTVGLYELLRSGNVLERTKLGVMSIVRKVAAPLIMKEMGKKIEKMTFKTSPKHHINNTLPEKGLSHAEVMQLATHLRTELDESFEEGHLSGTVYHGGKDLTKTINDTLILYQWTNPLHMDTYGSVRQMEAEIVQMCVNVFNGGADCCGGVTSGGTDSICMAIKSHREWHAERRNITRPNLVCPVTAHPAFDKACHYYGIEKITVPVDASTGVVDVEELERYITDDTICIVGSAVNYPYGTADDIAAMSDLALKHGCGLHVDCCLGGLVLQFLEDAGVKDVPVVDFRLPGVCTISVDTHKFGYAPKGSSVVLFNSRELRKEMFFAISSWPGGLYASPGYNGSRPGNLIAGTWAAMMAMGKDGYVEAAHAVYRAMRTFCRGIEGIDGLFVLGKPQTSAVSFTSRVMDVYAVADRVKERFGWQLHTLQFPPAIQFSLTWVHSRPGIVEKFVEDIATVVEEIRKENKEIVAKGGKVALAGDSANMYGTQQRIPDRSIINTVTKAYIDKYYMTDLGPQPAKKEDAPAAAAAAAPVGAAAAAAADEKK